VSKNAESARAPVSRMSRAVAVLVGVAVALGVVAVPATGLVARKDEDRGVTIDEARSVAADAGRAATEAVELGANLALYVEAQRQATEEAELRQATEAYQAAVEAERSRTAVWDRIAQCETGGNWSMRGSRFSGGLGFANSTWASFGGREFASNAGLASREQQIIVAERLRDYGGYTGWGCAYTLGLVSR